MLTDIIQLQFAAHKVGVPMGGPAGLARAAHEYRRRFATLPLNPRASRLVGN
jgi:hypothetical protein